MAMPVTKSTKQLKKAFEKAFFLSVFHSVAEKAKVWNHKVGIR